MNNDIIVDSKLIETPVSKLDNDILNLKEIYKNLEIKMNNLDEIWTGEVKELCVQRYKEICINIEEKINNLEQFKSFLIESVGEYESFDAKTNESVDNS